MERRRSPAWGLLLVGVGVAAGVRAALGRRARLGPASEIRTPSWLGRRLDPYRGMGEGGDDPPPLLPGEVVPVPGRGEMFIRHARPASAEESVPVLLLHGWMAGADLNWFLVYRSLAGRHRVIAPDARGHGRGIRSRRRFSLEDCADDAAELLRAMGVERAVVVGYSMGGPIALLLWRRHPDLVAGLVLEATGLEFNSTPLQRWTWRLLGAMGFLLRWPTGRIILFRLGGTARDLPRELLTYRGWADGEFRRNDPLEMVEAGRALSNFDAAAFAAEVDVPTAVVVTTRDRLVPPDRQRALADATRARVFEFEGDHIAVAERPEEFADVTLRAIEAVSSSAESGEARTDSA